MPATRHPIAPVAAVAVLAAVLMALVAAAPARADAPVPGVQAHLLWSGVDAADADRQLDAAAGAGARLVRVDVGWASLEPAGKGRWSAWELSRLDHVVAAAARRGLRLLLTLWETPCWASSAPESLRQGCAGAWWERGVQRHAPADARDYADALAFLAARYRGRVAAWEIWNEPNAASYLRSEAPARDYAALVRASYGPAKAADPAATVVAGSLMWADFAFADALYAHGIAGHFDAFSVHPYSDDRSPLDPGLDRWISGSFVRGVEAVRRTMLARGDDRPLWLTEFGWSTTSTRGGESWLSGVDEATQARYVAEALAQLRRWSFVAVGVYYELIDTGTDRSSTIENFGLLRHDGTPKPAYGAMRAGAEALAAPERAASYAGSAAGGAARRLGRGAGAGSARHLGRRRLPPPVVRRVRGGLRVTGRAAGPRAKVVLRFSRRGAGARARFALRVRADRRGTYRRLVRRAGRWRVRAVDARGA
jgi:hypothetical protein